MTALGALLGALVGLGVVLVVAGLRPDLLPPPAPRRPGRHRVVPRTQLVRAAGVALPVAVVTRWPVATAAAAALGWFARDLVPARTAREATLDRTEAVAGWTEMLRDVIVAGQGLEEAVQATAPAAPAPIREQVADLATRLERHQPLDSALRRFATELNDPTADLVVAALTRAADPSGIRDLTGLLTALAAAVRQEAAMHLRIETARARVRTSRNIITVAIVAIVACLMVFLPDFLAPYDDALGQAVLALVLGCFAAGLVMLQRMGRITGPERFLDAGRRLG